MYGISDELKKIIDESAEHMEGTMEVYDSLEEKFQPIVELIEDSKGAEFSEEFEKQLLDYESELNYEINAYTESFNERKEQLEAFIRESYDSAESEQLLAKIENMNIENAQISAEELQEIERKIEEENEREIERIEAFQTLVKDIALSASVVTLAEEYKEIIEEKNHSNQNVNDDDLEFG